MFIRGTAAISPQHSFQQLTTAPVQPMADRFVCAEPDYSSFIDARMIRRMSRIIKMGVAAAKDCLQLAELEMPDAIVTGTAYGCLADTELFLSRMIEYHETLLTPTAFIQSTHNTVGAQIALLLKCHHYNNTFVHRGFSFESSLLDAMTLIHEKTASAVLVGGVDEITDSSHLILKRFGLFRREVVSGDWYGGALKGTINGEGAAFFVLSDTMSQTDYADLRAVHTLYKPANAEEVKWEIQDFLARHQCSMEEIDLVLCGDSGDAKGDAFYKELRRSVLAGRPYGRFKHLCGDYPTATAFALWLGAEILKQGTVPPNVLAVADATQPKNILIYNHFQNIHHSFYLLSAC